MEITEVRIKLMEDSDDRLQAFCSITFDNAFVVRDLKIIEGTNGPFVAMPSRKLTSHCPNCGYKNHLRAHFCNQCGSRLKEERAVRDADGRVKLYADIAHPINAACREQIQTRVIAEFHSEVERAQQPGYVSRYDEDYDLDFEEDGHGAVDEHRPPRVPASNDTSRTAHRAPTPPAPHFSSAARAHGMSPVHAANDEKTAARTGESLDRTIAKTPANPAASSVTSSVTSSPASPVPLPSALPSPAVTPTSSLPPSPASPSPGESTLIPPVATGGTSTSSSMAAAHQPSIASPPPASTLPTAPASTAIGPPSSSSPANPRRTARFGEGIFDPPADGS